jgi:hypothetical protein
MKRQWEPEELIEHFTLVESERVLLANKTGASRLGFAVLLKCFSSGGDNRLKRLVELAIHPLESSKNHCLLTGLLRMNWGACLFSIMIIIREGEGGRGVPRPPS